MPIYEYECKSCKKYFETMQKASDEPLAQCPTCGKKVSRVMSRTSFALKGGGWYKDGYASGGKKTSDTSSPKSSPKEKGSKEKSSNPPGSK
ncbi:MAG: zinc ribbon domain-containing protein [Pseudomonadota bacterium]